MEFRTQDSIATIHTRTELPLSRGRFLVLLFRVSVLPAAVCLSATWLSTTHTLDAILIALALILFLCGTASAAERQIGYFLGRFMRFSVVLLSTLPTFLLAVPLGFQILSPFLALALMERQRRRSLSAPHRSWPTMFRFTPDRGGLILEQFWLNRRIEVFTRIADGPFIRPSQRYLAEQAAGTALAARFDSGIAGAGADLDRAVEYFRRACAGAPADSPRLLSIRYEHALLLTQHALLHSDGPRLRDSRDMLYEIMREWGSRLPPRELAELRFRAALTDSYLAEMKDRLDWSDAPEAADIDSAPSRHEELKLILDDPETPDGLRVAITTMLGLRHVMQATRAMTGDPAEDRMTVLDHSEHATRMLTSAVAITDSRQPLTVEEVGNWLTARSLLALGLLIRHRYTAQWQRGETSEDYDRAWALLEERLATPVVQASTATVAGDLAMALLAAGLAMDVEMARSDWGRAISLGEAALENFRATLTSVAFRADREHAIRFSEGLHHRLAYAMARKPAAQDELHRLLAVLETGRAISFSETLARGDLLRAAGRLAAAGHHDLAKETREVVARIAEWNSRQIGAHDGNSVRMRGLRDEQADVSALDSLRLLGARAKFLLDRADEVLGPSGNGTDELHQTLLTAAADAPLCYLLHLPAGLDGVAPDLPGLAVVLVPDGDLLNPATVLLPRLTGTAVRRWLDQEFGPALLAELGEHIMGPVLTVAGSPDRLTLLPDGRLGALPLHAALLPSGRAVITETTVCYAPNAAVMATCRNRAVLLGGDALPPNYVGVAEPVPTPHRRLKAALPEVTTVAPAYPNHRVIKRQRATPDAVRKALVAAASAPATPAVLHFSCHAIADVDEPLLSHLSMAGDEPGRPSRLTLADLLRLNLAGTRLAILSACQTGLAGTVLPEEFTSLGGAFLQVGAAGTIASLTEVDDQTCLALVARFHHEWSVLSTSPAEAFRRAQVWFATTPAADISVWLETDTESELVPPEVIGTAQRDLTWVPFAYYGALLFITECFYLVTTGDVLLCGGLVKRGEQPRGSSPAGCGSGSNRCCRRPSGADITQAVTGWMTARCCAGPCSCCTPGSGGVLAP